MNKKQMKQAIKDKYATAPEWQVKPGIYIHTIGNKYITLLNTWDETSLEKLSIEKFYKNYI